MTEGYVRRASLNRAWIRVSAALPPGWRLQGLTCASSGLAPEERSDRWRAIATGPNGEHVHGEADWPAEALWALVRELARVQGTPGTPGLRAGR